MSKFKGFLQKQRWMLALIFLCTLTLALEVLTRCLEPTVSRDSLLYLFMIREYNFTDGFPAILEVYPWCWFPPLTMSISGCLHCCGVPLEIAVILFHMICGVLMPVIVWGIALEITGQRRIALGAAALMAVAPSVLELSVQAQRDMPYLFFMGLLIYFGVRGIKYRKFYDWILGGIFFSLGFLCRYEVWEMIFIGLLVLVVVMIKDAKYWKRHLINTGIFLISALCTIVFFAALTHSENYLKKTYPQYFQWKLKTLETMYLRGDK